MIQETHYYSGTDAPERARAAAEAYLASYHPAGYGTRAQAFGQWVDGDDGQPLYQVRLVFTRSSTCD